jgi:hypothetical protein
MRVGTGRKEDRMQTLRRVSSEPIPRDLIDMIRSATAQEAVDAERVLTAQLQAVEHLQQTNERLKAENRKLHTELLKLQALLAKGE